MITKDPEFPIPASLSKAEVNMQETKPDVVQETISVTANEQDGSSSHETPLEVSSTELSLNRCVCPVNMDVDTDMGENAIVQIEEVVTEPGSVQQTALLQTGANKELPKPPAPETVSIVGSCAAATALPHAVIGEGDNIHICIMDIGL